MKYTKKCPLQPQQTIIYWTSPTGLTVTESTVPYWGLKKSDRRFVHTDALRNIIDRFKLNEEKEISAVRRVIIGEYTKDVDLQKDIMYLYSKSDKFAEYFDLIAISQFDPEMSLLHRIVSPLVNEVKETIDRDIRELTAIGYKYLLEANMKIYFSVHNNITIKNKEVRLC